VFRITVRLESNSAYLLGILLGGDGRKLISKMLYLKCVLTTCTSDEKRERVTFSLKK